MRLILRGIACLRGPRLLFEGLDLTLEASGALVVTGPNGAGKSSLLRIAAGLLRPDAGTVERDGKVAWLGEQAALDGEMPLRDAFAFWARLDSASAAMLDEAMTMMGVENLSPVPVRYLSTGQRRRAAIARILASDCPIWLLDEPANGLDAEGVGRLGDAMAAHRAKGGAIVAATHLPLPLDGADTLDIRTFGERWTAA